MNQQNYELVNQSLLKRALATAGLLTLVSLTGCLGLTTEEEAALGPPTDTGIPDNGEPVEKSQVKAAIQNSFHNLLDETRGIIDSETLESIDELMNSEDNSGDQENENPNDLTHSDNLNIAQVSRALMGEVEAATSGLDPEEIKDESNVFFDYLFSDGTPTQDGKISYVPDPKICSELLATNSPQACIESFSNLMILQTAKTNQSGYLEFYFSSHRPLTMSYSANEIVFEFHIADLFRSADIAFRIIERVDGENMPSLGEAMGIIELGIRKTADGVAQLKLELKENFEINMELENEFPARLKIDWPTQIIASLDPNERTASLRTNIGRVQANFPITGLDQECSGPAPDSCNDVEYPAQLMTSEFNGQLSIDEKNRALIGQDIGFSGGTGVMLLVDGENRASANIGDLSFILVAADDHAEFQFYGEPFFGLGLIEAVSAGKDLPRLFKTEGNLFFDIFENTELQIQKVTRNDPASGQHETTQYLVQSGGLFSIGTHDFRGSTIAFQGHCFWDNQSSETEFPFTSQSSECVILDET